MDRINSLSTGAAAKVKAVKKTSLVLGYLVEERINLW